MKRALRKALTILLVSALIVPSNISYAADGNTINTIVDETFDLLDESANQEIVLDETNEENLSEEDLGDEQDEELVQEDTVSKEPSNNEIVEDTTEDVNEIIDEDSDETSNVEEAISEDIIISESDKDNIILNIDDVISKKDIISSISNSILGISTMAQPGAFSITSPSEGDVVTGNITIRWSSSSGASQYKISVRDLDTNELVVDNYYTTSRSYSLRYSKLNPGNIYRIGVVSISSDGTTKNGGTVTFIAAPGSFSITSPSDGSNITANTTIRWETSDGASYYKISVRDLNTDRLVVDNYKTTARSYSLRYSNLTAGHEYRIGVVSFNSHENAVRNGGTVNFTAGEKLGTFDITSPTSNQEIEEGTNVTAKWSACTGASYYMYSLQDTTDWKWIIETTRASQRSATINSSLLTAGHKYRLWVKACSSDGATEVHEDVYFSVVAKKVTLGTFDITSPSSDQEIEEGTNVTAKWSACTGASYYMYSLQDTTDWKWIIETTRASQRSVTISSSLLTAGHKYRLWVKACSSDGATEVHEDVYFTVVAKKSPLGTFEITSPKADQEIGEGDDVKVTWSVCSGASYYSFSLQDTTDWKWIVETTRATQRSTVIRGNLLTAGHKYRLWVKACTADGTTEVHENIYFSVVKKNVPVKAFSLSGFNADAVYAGQNLTIYWTKSANADHYRVALSNKTLGKMAVNSYIVNGTSTTISGSYLLKDNKYELYVVAYDADETKDLAYRITTPFTVKASTENKKPGSFSLSGFDENAVYAGQSLTVRWTASANADHYRFALVNNTSGKTVIASTKVTGTNYTISGSSLVASNKYTMYVVAYDASETSNTAVRVSKVFTVKASTVSQKPGSFSLSNFDENSVYANENKTISWTKSANADHYKFALINNTSGKTVIASTKVSGTSYTISGSYLVADNKYTMYVVAYDASETSSTAVRVSKTFTAKERPGAKNPGSFSLTGFDENKIYAGTNCTVAWTKSANADHYKVALCNNTTGKYVISSTKVTGTSYTITGSNLVANNKYTLYVVAYDAKDTSSTSKKVTKSFTVKASAENAKPGSFSLSGFDKDAVYAGNNYTVKWTTSANADHYRFAIKNEDTKKYIVESTKVNGTSYTISGSDLVANNTYTLFITAYDANETLDTAAKINTKFTATVKPGTYTKGKFTSYGTNYLLLSPSKGNYISDKKIETKQDATYNVIRTNLENLVYGGDYIFSQQQKNCILSIPETIMKSDKVYFSDLKGNLEFRFDGVGKGSSYTTSVDTLNREVNIPFITNGYVLPSIFNAMTVVLKDGDVAGVFFRTSTLPDSYTDKCGGYDPAVIADGWYSLYKCNHQGSFAALNLQVINGNRNGEIPAIYSKELNGDSNHKTAKGINIHHNYGYLDQGRGSAGCLTVMKADWSAYINLYGHSNATGNSGDKWKTGLDDYAGKIYVERCYYISITADKKLYEQYAHCKHVVNK